MNGKFILYFVIANVIILGTIGIVWAVYAIREKKSGFLPKFSRREKRMRDRFDRMERRYETREEFFYDRQRYCDDMKTLRKPERVHKKNVRIMMKNERILEKVIPGKRIHADQKDKLICFDPDFRPFR